MGAKGRRTSRSGSGHLPLSDSDAEEERRTSSRWLVIGLIAVCVSLLAGAVLGVLHILTRHARGDSSAGAPDGAVELDDCEDSPAGTGGGSSPQLEPPARSNPEGALGSTPGGPGAQWPPTPKPDPALIQVVFSEENPVWEVFYQCECTNVETTEYNGRRWIKGWVGRGQIPASENFVDAVRRIGTQWAASPSKTETEVVHFMRADKEGNTLYYLLPKSVTAEMCLNDTFGDCAKTYDPSHRLSFLETKEPWRLSTLLVRKRQFTL